MPAEKADARQQEGHAEGRPEKSAGRRLVADQRFMRPVVRIGDGVVRALGPRGPGRPPEEGRQHAPVFRVRHGAVLHRIGFAQFRRRRVVAEQALVMRGHLADRLRPFVAERDRLRFRIVGIGAHDAAQPPFERRLPLRAKLRIRNAVLGLRPAVEHGQRLAVQPVRAPVRRHIAAMAPDRAELHPTHRLPDLPALLDFGAAIDRRAVRRHHAVGHGRRRFIDARPAPQQHAERNHQQHAEQRPQFPCIAHLISPLVMPVSVPARMRCRTMPRSRSAAAPAVPCECSCE